MQFLRTLFWVVLAVTLVVFSNRNWHAVTVRLWGGLELDAKLPVLLLGAFLLGFVPMLLVHRAKRWSLRRKIEGLERQIAESRPVEAPAPEVPPAVAPLAPEAAPIAASPLHP